MSETLIWFFSVLFFYTHYTYVIYMYSNFCLKRYKLPSKPTIAMFRLGIKLNTYIGKCIVPIRYLNLL